MFAGTALSVRLFVCAGLSLFIICGPYLSVVVCVFYAYNLTPPQLHRTWKFSDDLTTSNHPQLSGSDLLSQNFCRLPPSPPKDSTFSWRTWTFCVHFRFGYIKSSLPPGSDLLTQNLNILCALQIIPSPCNQTFFMVNLDILCVFQILPNKITSLLRIKHSHAELI